MKFFKKAIIFLAILAIAGFAYWYFDLKKEKEKQQKEQKEALLFEETERDIVRITIKTGGEAEIIMDRREKGPVSDDKSDDDETWDITSPVKTLGDRYAIDALINSLRRVGTSPLREALGIVSDPITNFTISPGSLLKLSICSLRSLRASSSSIPKPGLNGAKPLSSVFGLNLDVAFGLNFEVAVIGIEL